MIRAPLIAPLVLLSSVLVAEAAPTRWDVNGHFYEAIAVPQGISWANASTQAQLAGGHLATITSAVENAFVFSLITDTAFWRLNTSHFYDGPWIGGFQPPGSPEPGGNWQWVTGEPFVYQNWSSPMQPDNTAGIEDKLHFWGISGTVDSKWNDHNPLGADGSVSGVRGYVVETVPEPSTFCLIVIGLAGWCLVSLRKRGRP
jgi:hypothetical protein